MLNLAVEMNHIAQDVFLKLGVSPEEQRTAALRARKTKSRLRPSARLMAAITDERVRGLRSGGDDYQTR
jgi:hypothetical protein